MQLLCRKTLFQSYECRITPARFPDKKEESLDSQGFLDGSGDRIRTNDTLDMEQTLTVSGRSDVIQLPTTHSQVLLGKITFLCELFENKCSNHKKQV